MHNTSVFWIIYIYIKHTKCGNSGRKHISCFNDFLKESLHHDQSSYSRLPQQRYFHLADHKNTLYFFLQFLFCIALINNFRQDKIYIIFSRTCLFTVSFTISVLRIEISSEKSIYSFIIHFYSVCGWVALILFSFIILRT